MYKGKDAIKKSAKVKRAKKGKINYIEGIASKIVEICNFYSFKIFQFLSNLYIINLFAFTFT